MADLDGPMGSSVAKSALGDLSAICVFGATVGGVPFAGWPGPPKSWEEAADRLLELLRAVERSKGGGGSGGGGGQPHAPGGGGGGGGGGGVGGSHKPPPGSSVAVPVVDMSKHADKAGRAATANVLAPLVANEVVWQARTGSVVSDDPIREARRVIDEMEARDTALGTAAKAFIGSNGMVVGQLSGARDARRRAVDPPARAARAAAHAPPPRGGRMTPGCARHEAARVRLVVGTGREGAEPSSAASLRSDKATDASAADCGEGAHAPSPPHMHHSTDPPIPRPAIPRSTDPRPFDPPILDPGPTRSRRGRECPR